MSKLTIQKNIPLADLTTLRIGGLAKFFCVASNETELLEALDFASEKKIDFFVLGGGSNILFSDKGFSGLVIKMQGALEIKQKDKFIECWAGENLNSIVNFFKNNNFSGMEWAVGIPGTVGGAIRGNAGAYGGQMENNISSVRVFNLENKISADYSCKDCQFAYRTSIFKKNPQLIVLAVKLKFKKSQQEIIKQKMQEIITKRNTAMPKGFSAGSFFQNPIVKNTELILQFEKDTGKKSQEGKIPAGWLIEEIGFRGKKIGGVMVSKKHANFFINDGTGTAEDVVILAGIIKQKLRKEFDVQIKEEIIYVGF